MNEKEKQYKEELIALHNRVVDREREYESEHTKRIVTMIFMGLAIFFLLLGYSYENTAKLEAWEDMYHAYQVGYNEGWENAWDGYQFNDEVPPEYDKLD